ncbi:MAG: type II secretion system F family protein [Candidatus Wallbacteria bacterium]|nr:type II secretion system F family protein [Candidatus Wallbacteria bacterium]
MQENRRVKFYDALAGSLNAGLPLTRSLSTCRGLLPDVVIDKLCSAVDSGQALGDVLPQFPEVFPDFDRKMLDLAARTGNWPHFLKSLSGYYAARVENAYGFASGIAYPFFLAHMAILLPEIGRWATDGMFSYLLRVLPQLFVFYAVIGYLVFSFLDKKSRERLIKIPYLSTFLQGSEFTDFLQVLGIQLDAGINVHEALHGAAGILKTGSLIAKISRADLEISRGATFSEAMGKSGTVTDKSLLASIASGEVSGTLPRVILAESGVLRAKHQKSLRLATKILSALVFGLTAALIAFKIVGFYLNLGFI